MSEQIENSKYREAELKELILNLHSSKSQEWVKHELVTSLGAIPYGEVVEVEQELIEDGLPVEEVLKLCDIHSAALEGNVDLSVSKTIPAGHPVDVLLEENRALTKLIDETSATLSSLGEVEETELRLVVLQLSGRFNQLMDADKHYLRKQG
jgi:hypothetical protein